ncbi:MAG: replication factor C large subunit [Candidatus Lokiarchaeota archaeon]|nr:replication factor C large subunit [Candidatus Lokiarchaeota archaeon]
MSESVLNKMPWVEKYRPKSMSEMALPSAKLKGHKIELAEELRKFIKTFFREKRAINQKNQSIKSFNRLHGEKEQKKLFKLSQDRVAILLEGPPGVGKTSIVYALANDLNLDVIETNASDVRTKKSLESKLTETVKTRGIMDYLTQSKDKIILIDEIDGLYGVADKGAVPTILTIIDTTQFPIIMCSNEYKQSLQPLYNKIHKLEINPLSSDETLRIIKQILKKEKITNVQEGIINSIIEKNHGDLRGMINDLQGISQGSIGKLNSELINSLHRDSTEEIFMVIRDLFEEVSTLKQAKVLTNKSDVDYNFLYKWVNENIPSFIKLNSELVVAYENLSIADQIFGRIQKNQYWSTLPYFYDLFAGGVTLAQKSKRDNHGFKKVSFPRYRSTGMFSLTANERLVVEKINKKYEISEIEAIQDFLPFLRVLSGTSRKQLKLVSDWLELDATEKKILKSDSEK